jgi:hypothetical protein
MGVQALRHWRAERAEDSTRAGAEKLRVAVAQLDCADLYLAAAVNLEIDDQDLAWMLDDVRRHVLWARDQLARPRSVEA